MTVIEPVFGRMEPETKRPPRGCHHRGTGRHLTRGDDVGKGTCSIDGCSREQYARTWCSPHYQRWRKYGDPAYVLPPRPIKLCSEPDCERRAKSRGMCQYHYADWHEARTLPREDRPRAEHARRGEPDEDRFLAKVDKAGPLPESRPDLGPCWIWRAALRHGYGVFWALCPDGNRRTVPAHRWAYEHWRGPVPEGLVLDHFACDRPPCCNPEHVQPVTHHENILRGRGFSGKNARKTHCPNGHPYDEANTILDSGSRKCRICKRARDSEYVARRRAKR